MSSRPVSKKKLALLMVLLEEEEEIEDEIDFIVGRLCKVRKSVSSMYTSREKEGVFKLLIHRHLLDDDVKFKSYFRVTRCQFEYLLSLVENDLESQSCNRITSPISAAEKLALTLRFLATGESYRSLAFSYRISSAYISTFVPKVLQALRNRLLPLNMPPPEDIDWEQKESEFWKRWDFPNVVAALDGKHVRIVAPNNTGSLFFNYKKHFSIVLLALVDANCKFVVVDIGSYGKEGDAGIFRKSKLGRVIENGTVIFPPPKYLPNSNILLPHVVVGDEAFRLDKHMMKPYCKKQAIAEKRKRHFNYHLCRARRVTENAFGIMCSVFRIFYTPINVKPETVDLVIIVCCCLHNFLRDAFIEKNPNHGEIVDSVHDFPVENMIPLAGTGGFAKAEGFKVRERFSEYFDGKYAKRKQ